MGFFLDRYKKMDSGFEPEVPQKKYLRMNTLIQDEATTFKQLKHRMTIKKTPLPYCYSFEADFAPASSIEHLSGHFYLQGLASQVVANALKPQEDWLIIDMAAAPGSKTTHIAQLMNNTGRILALDKSRERLLAVRDNCERLGVLNVIAIRKDARFALDLPKADAILLDAPCSGNYCSEEDWETKRTIEGVQENARLQKDLLRTGYKLLKPGGVLLYSTCSLEPEENEFSVDYALSLGFSLEDIDLPDLGQSPGLTSFEERSFDPSLAKTLRFWPYKAGTEGFYLAKLRKPK